VSNPNAKPPPPGAGAGFVTFRSLLKDVDCFCPRCNTRLKLSPVGKQLAKIFIRALLSGRRFTVPGYLTIELDRHVGHWQPTTLISHWPHVLHKPSWIPGYVRLQLRARTLLRWRLRQLRKKSEPDGPPPANW
jgi:hypothetical protein